MNKRGAGINLALESMFMIYTLMIIIFGIILIQSTIMLTKAENSYADDIQSATYAYRLVNSPECFGYRQPNRIEQYIIDVDKVNELTLEKCLPETFAKTPPPVKITLHDIAKATKKEIETSTWQGNAKKTTTFDVTIVRTDKTTGPGKIIISGLGVQ